METSKPKETKFLGLPNETMLDIVGVKGDQVIVKKMTVRDWINLKKKKDWEYKAYKEGFHSFTVTE